MRHLIGRIALIALSLLCLNAALPSRADVALPIRTLVLVSNSGDEALASAAEKAKLTPYRFFSLDDILRRDPRLKNLDEGDYSDTLSERDRLPINKLGLKSSVLESMGEDLLERIASDASSSGYFNPLTISGGNKNPLNAKVNQLSSEEDESFAQQMNELCGKKKLSMQKPVKAIILERQGKQVNRREQRLQLSNLSRIVFRAPLTVFLDGRQQPYVAFLDYDLSKLDMERDNGTLNEDTSPSHHPRRPRRRSERNYNIRCDWNKLYIFPLKHLVR